MDREKVIRLIYKWKRLGYPDSWHVIQELKALLSLLALAGVIGGCDRPKNTGPIYIEIQAMCELDGKSWPARKDGDYKCHIEDMPTN